MSCNPPLLEELKAQRERLGWPVAELAQRSGIDEDALSGWECGTAMPMLGDVQRWAATLGLDIKVLPGHVAGPRVRIDWEGRVITVDGAPVRLTPMEWRALERLARNAGELVSHQALYRHLYDEDRCDRAQSTAVRVLMTKLRRLLPLRIEARWGQGYIVSGIEPPPGANAAAKGPEAMLAAAASDAGFEPVEQPRVRPPNFTVVPLTVVPQTGGNLASAPAAPRRAGAPMRREPAACGEPGLPHVSVGVRRNEELSIIERFLAERGATRCPDVATIQKSPLPTLVWDKIKRKWVRPAIADCSAG